MNEQEMQQEIERLRRELAEVREDRDALHKTLCAMIPVKETNITPEEFEEIRKNARDVHEVLRDLFPPEMQYLISNPTNGKPDSSPVASK